MPPPLILASASPARRALLQSAGIAASVQPSYFDESLIEADCPWQLVERLAEAKAAAVAAQVTEDALVLGCDSVLALAGEVYGKPESRGAAIARWQQMRGNTGHLYTGHALMDLGQNRHVVRCQVTEVMFANASNRQIEAYVDTEEPLNCAGCFAIDGRGGLLVEKLVGCPSNVIGLSLPLLRQMLASLGYDIADFWA
ncbi:septum formation inhibitor Maf [Synechococcales cyanobacterium C]|uniref:Nucleoside triphosphate pyrophosphatase n=1 Tax=Petrachloros mirabilis ULC683 TaxID=2781853 RepID=A0A8K2A921_9CYAN|nr:nucleoside triphosphate pyrophosphatase [Petrachloros mirabilis]NCJ08661.1 septum formation inhibitor Maf [Petrachloros mirabilis ULC683]